VHVEAAIAPLLGVGPGSSVWVWGRRVTGKIFEVMYRYKVFDT